MLGNEDVLKALKSDLAALDRKISAEIAPKEENTTAVEEIKQDKSQHQATNTVAATEPPDKSQDSKESMVAEPRQQYQSLPTVQRPMFRPSGI